MKEHGICAKCKKSVGCPYADDRIKGCKKFVLENELELTNEEWLCSLSTEEKVTALLDLRERIRIKMRGEIGSENKFYKGDYYREWLKEEHNA